VPLGLGSASNRAHAAERVGGAVLGDVGGGGVDDPEAVRLGILARLPTP
jgi:hypothetical protein